MSAQFNDLPVADIVRPGSAYDIGEARVPVAWLQAAWLLGGFALAFFVPFVFADTLQLPRDVYYAVYAVTVCVFLGLWARRAPEQIVGMLRRHPLLTAVSTAVSAAVLVVIVLSKQATGRPDGLELLAAVLWRGIVYGAVDGLLLSVFPILAVFALSAGTRARRGWLGRIAIGLSGLLASLAMTAVYHAGYSDFRSGKVRQPLLGDVIWSSPTLLTLNPLGAPVAHMVMHTTAVLHSYDTDVFLPPHRESLDGAQLQGLLDKAVTGSDRLAPGATAFVAASAGTWSGAAGYSDLQAQTPMPVDARMRLESVSKIWTATLIYQLAEGRELRLSDTVSKWLPNVLPYGNRITIADLLSHRSGLIDNNDVVRSPARYIAKVRDPKFRADLGALQRRLQKDPTTEFSPWVWIRLAAYQPLLWPPGTSYHYSNIGFEILGLIAVRAGGKSLADLYRERIFEPLELGNTRYDPQGPIVGAHATGYNLTANRATDATAAHPGVGAEGGIVSDAPDTARFLIGLMRGKLLSDHQLAVMKQGFWSGGNATGCGGDAYGHSGGGYGFKTDVWVSDDGSRVAVLLLNARGDLGRDAAAGALMERLYCAADAGGQ